VLCTSDILRKRWVLAARALQRRFDHDAGLPALVRHRLHVAAYTHHVIMSPPHRKEDFSYRVLIVQGRFRPYFSAYHGDHVEEPLSKSKDRVR
jgi:hypothetical protein